MFLLKASHNLKMPIPPKIDFIKFTLVVTLTVSETVCQKKEQF